MRSHTPSLVGRDPQLAQLERAMAEARQGQGGAVFLVGEAGVGKSRLAAEAVGGALDSGMRVLRGRSSTTGPAVPFRPLTEALMSLFRGGEPMDDLPLGPYRPVLGRLIPDWDTGERDSSSMVILGEAVLRLLIATGRGQGQLLFLEDLHDADPETLGVLEYMVDNLVYTPVLLVATVRTDISDALDLAQSARRRGAAALVELAPLTRPQVHEVIAAQLGADSLDDVPAEVLQRLWEDSAGSPYLVEELLQSMIGSGALVQGPGGWRAVADLRRDVSSTLARGILRRIDRLGAQGLTLLSAAAVLGRRFPLSVLQRMTGVDDRALLGHLHASVAARLVVPDEPAPDWYSFRHSPTVKALFTQMTPGQRADLARRGAEAVEELHPALESDWCALAAGLRCEAGDRVEAGLLYADAGERALAAGALNSAVTLLSRAEGLLAEASDPQARAAVLENLLPALAESGDFARALDLVDDLHALDGAGLSAVRLATLHARLAKVAHTAGRWSDGNRQIARAREVLTAAPGETAEVTTAAVDVTAAYLALDTPGPDRTQHAEKLARSAADIAERHGLPVVACQAWELLATVARERDPQESAAMLQQALTTAERNRLPLQRMYAATRMGGNAWLAEGDTSGLLAARQEALRLGSVNIVHTVDGILVLDAVLRGENTSARAVSEECLAVVRRLRLAPAVRYVLMARATLEAHRGDRVAMEAALAAFAEWDGAGSQEEPLSLGLARVFCSLLEEDRELARAELGTVLALEADNPSTYHLSGTHGLVLLLDVLAGHADRVRHEEIRATAMAQMRWNRQFVHLAEAVLLGREGAGPRAAAAVETALAVAEPYPLAQHLGLRLIADAAHEDGWGDPVGWLRRAEHYFHERDIAAVTGACRAGLRRLGAPVHQHRSGTSGIPEHLRTQGVTVREFDVFRLLAERLSNKDIADRLFISPRTAEKHIASLITKTGAANRADLCARSAALRDG
ncbi:helix-turn-helix transcriptional regulator [Streptomyces physcomitrii]|uniref:AAA family ATPase n=1 Tax=Streptomyces physcomitrii TaxID=2724184 RepID=A0ABX1HDL5_9ACTN|nr:LuxR family transcriptional regulator [Streptomyces physcomitrii]NKI45269.1 AAA family ATPase [Streptomyces physcomitrii]